MEKTFCKAKGSKRKSGFPARSFLGVDRLNLGLEAWRILGQLLQGELLRLVVGQAEVVAGTEEGILDFEEFLDPFVDPLDGVGELGGRQFVIPAEGGFEIAQLGFEIGDVDVPLLLRFDFGQGVGVLSVRVVQ